MDEQAAVVAVLVPNPALGAVLGMVLNASPHLRARVFRSQPALAAYMRLAPVDLVVLDFDNSAALVDLAATALGGDSPRARKLQIIALAGRVSAATRDAAATAGIDEVLVKPMSPKYLLERVLSRLRSPAQPAGRSGAPQRSDVLHQPPASPRLARSDPKVVPLFGRRLGPLH